jgi:hypothetical protein
MKKLFLFSLITLCICQVSSAQMQAQASTNSELIGFRRGLATVMLAGLGGAILGLSTLSFYGDPQEHVGNIWTGLAVGALGGGLYVASQSRISNLAASSEIQPLASVAGQPGSFRFHWVWDF